MIIDYELKHGTVNIIGKGPSQSLIVDSVEGQEVWSVNDHLLPATTLHWDIHPQWSDKRIAHFNLQTPWCGYPPVVISPNMKKMIPNGIVFRREEVKEVFKREYLSNATCYQLCAAIHLGAKVITLFGHDMTGDRDTVRWEQPCMEYWIGVAEAKEIKVIIPEESNLMRTNPGGHEPYPFYMRHQLGMQP